MILLGIVASVWLPWYSCVIKKTRDELKIKNC